ncbi:MAG: sporulation protein YabP [Lachnospiraceae bacterium]|nr:sporulation protein YabP [Lachnospiraceae bacterium]MBQ8845710.1 sporulation protein YabP [Lachnospiraceae bacterium]
MEQKQEVGAHKLSLIGRKSLSLTGVKEVVSFDAKEVILETVQGMLLLRGDEMNVTRLLVEKGEVDLDGRIDSMVYTERGRGKNRSESFAKRLFG